MPPEISPTEPPTSHVIDRLRKRDALIGWQFELYSDVTETWTTVTILEDQLTETDVRDQHGPIRQLTPLIPLGAMITLLNDDGHKAAVSQTLLDPLPRDSEPTMRRTQQWTTVQPTAADSLGDGHE